MKKLMLTVTAMTFLPVFYNPAHAQEKKSIPAKVKSAAKTTGNKVAETASKASSRVVDKIYKGKTGPDGQTIYITSKSEYYWVDKGGHRVYMKAEELKDKS